MNTIIELLLASPWVNVITATVTLASAITALTPTPKAGSSISKIYKVIEIIAINIGKAKDK
jgi:hypothetical protein